MDEGAVGVGIAVLPTTEGGGEELATTAFGHSDDSRQAAIREKRVKGTAYTVGVVVARLVGEGTPLGGLVDEVGLEDEAVLGADDVVGGVVEHNLCLLLAVAAERV
ncbi:hypothetical protein LR48_Vigan11g031400 [Vigna angularis]|uniref:Uncharacterized protein n=1 Tax=Phaseolus angularis TaxID=3914 RepID=A0A0L9VQX1_PHAAN|nr:hypothetical protein LR48_Vigan11g031400 [Vigna angularis]